MLNVGKSKEPFKCVDGKQYDRELFERAQIHESDGTISFDEVKDLVRRASKEGFTDIRRDTLMYVLQNLDLTDKAKTHLKGQLESSKWKKIEDKAIDPELLKEAEDFADDGAIGYPEAKKLWPEKPLTCSVQPSSSSCMS